MSSQATNPAAIAIARSLLLDREAGKAVERLECAGIPVILLKGAAIATWLYRDGVARPYLDVDLLVAPSQFTAARDELAALGYVPRLVGADPAELGPKELDLVGPREVCIDLHHGLLGTTAPPEVCWQVLRRHATTLRLQGGITVRILDVPARTMHLALHAAQDGPIDRKALQDLERGLALIPVDQWEQAAAIAEELGASEAFAAGLRLLPQGRRLADELALTTRMSVELALRITSAPQDALFFERLAALPRFRSKCSLIIRKLFPTAASLRANSPLANKGLAGLLGARVLHPITVATRLYPALAAWREARRAVATEQAKSRSTAHHENPTEVSGVRMDLPVHSSGEDGIDRQQAIVLNLGSGSRTSPNCVNVDWSPYLRLKRNRFAARMAPFVLRGVRKQRFLALDDSVLIHDLRRPLPFDDGTVAAVYHSHMLEHLDRKFVSAFLAEIRRVLRDDGIHRIVVPDFEAACRQYLEHLSACDTDATACDAHDVYIGNVIEQMVRREATGTSEQPRIRRFLENLVLGDARRRGETHQWMYDRVNLANTLSRAGFRDIRILDHRTSAIPNWNAIRLDEREDGGEYIAGSLYVEALK